MTYSGDRQPNPEVLLDMEAMRQTSVDVVVASMQVIRDYQLGLRTINTLDDKSDGSILTTVDLASEAAATNIWRARYPQVPILAEEGGLSSTVPSEILIMHDPIDGTRPFSIGGSTSTTISGLFDRSREKFVAATIGEPSTGRIWHTDGDRTMRTTIDVATGQPIGEVVTCKVWNGSIEDNAAVLVDNFAAFARGPEKRPILTNENVVNLFTSLQSKVAVQNYGSNGYHHALVANGGTRLAGSITTAMGGEWDTAGALAVINAGGVAQGYRMTSARTLEAADPLNPFGYDILLTANNADSLEFLEAKLVHSVENPAT